MYNKMVLKRNIYKTWEEEEKREVEDFGPVTEMTAALLYWSWHLWQMDNLMNALR